MTLRIRYHSLRTTAWIKRFVCTPVLIVSWFWSVKETSIFQQKQTFLSMLVNWQTHNSNNNSSNNCATEIDWRKINLYLPRKIPQQTSSSFSLKPSCHILFKYHVFNIMVHFEILIWVEKTKISYPKMKCNL